MSARAVARTLGPAGLLAGLALVLTLVSDAPAALSTHAGHLKDRYFVLPFIENIPKTPIAFVSVYDCAGQGHTHDAIISAAVANWNNTGRVKFFYTTGSTTPCDIDGFPESEGQVSILHDSSITRSTHVGRTFPHDSFRDNDLGEEGDVGLYPVRKNRIRVRPSSQEVATLVHELGHAAGLADLYNHGEDPPCIPAHKHNPDTTIMDCSGSPTPGQHDMDNLDALYKKRPTQVNDFVAILALLDGSQASVIFDWTDRSFNEKYQYIAREGYPYPLVVPRDAESAAWEGLQPDTMYCFFIRPVNGYGVLANQSLNTCRMTPALPTPTPAPCPSCGVGGVTELASAQLAPLGEVTPMPIPTATPPVLEIPAEPEFVTVNSTLVWRDTSDNEDGFRVYITINGEERGVFELGANVTSFEIPEELYLQCGETRWAVTAFNQAGETSSFPGVFSILECRLFEPTPTAPAILPTTGSSEAAGTSHAALAYALAGLAGLFAVLAAVLRYRRS